MKTMMTMTNDDGRRSCQQRPRQRDDSGTAVAAAIVCDTIILLMYFIQMICGGYYGGAGRTLRCVANRWPDKFGEECFSESLGRIALCATPSQVGFRLLTKLFFS